jgi:hypothetical protein
MSGHDMMLMVHKIMDESNELWVLIATVGEMDWSAIKAVVKNPVVVSIILTCPSCDGSPREIYQLRMDGDL